MRFNKQTHISSPKEYQNPIKKKNTDYFQGQIIDRGTFL